MPNTWCYEKQCRSYFMMVLWWSMIKFVRHGLQYFFNHNLFFPSILTRAGYRLGPARYINELVRLSSLSKRAEITARHSLLAARASSFELASRKPGRKISLSKKSYHFISMLLPQCTRNKEYCERGRNLDFHKLKPGAIKFETGRN